MRLFVARADAHRGDERDAKGRRLLDSLFAHLLGHERKSSVDQLLKRQNADGGWSQTKEMAATPTQPARPSTRSCRAAKKAPPSFSLLVAIRNSRTISPPRSPSRAGH